MTEWPGKPVEDKWPGQVIKDPPQDFLSAEVPGVFSEMGRSLKESGQTIAGGLNPLGRGEEGVFGGLFKTGGALAEIPAAIPKAIGAGIGAVGGPLMGAAEHAVGSVIAPKTAAKDRPEEMFRSGSEQVQTALPALRVPGGTIRGAPKIVQPAPTLEDQAFNVVLKRFNQDVKTGGPTAQGAMDLINEANARGRPLTLADVGGENVRALAGNVARQPGPSRNIARTFLEGRDEQAAQRLSGEIDRYISGGPSMHATTKALLDARSKASKKPWEDIRALENIWSPRLQEFFEDPVLKSGLKRGYEIERLEALSEGRPITATQMGIDLDTEGNVQIIKTPNMRLVDMARQGLDAMIADERNDITGRLSARGVALSKVRQAYVKEIEDLDKSGLYKKGREIWGGYSKSLDSVRMGRTIFQRSPEEIAEEFGRLSASDKEFYRIGVADMIRERMGKTGLGGDEAKTMVKSAWMRDQLKPIFKTAKDFEEFVTAVMQERQMFGTKQMALGGSQTAARLAEDTGGTGMAEGVISTGIKAVTGHPIKAAMSAWRLYRDLGLKPNPELNQKIAEILFRTPTPPAGP